MSVLIKGMGMPKNCYQCRMVDSCQCLWKPYDLDDYSDLQNMVEEGFTRADNCPLVEIPSHGRLIDMDGEIIVKTTIMRGEDCNVELSAPVIIPAEEGE